MRIKIIYDVQTEQTWAVRLVETGDRYGLEDKLIHTEATPFVEFYDTRFPHTDLGQFVSRYHVSTLLEAEDSLKGGLCLDGGTPSWTASSDAMLQVYAWLRRDTSSATQQANF